MEGTAGTIAAGGTVEITGAMEETAEKAAAVAEIVEITETAGTVGITGAMEETAGRAAVADALRMEETGSVITAADRITIVADRTMTAAAAAGILAGTAAMAARGYLRDLRRLRTALMELNRNRRIPGRGTRRRMTGIRPAVTGRVRRKR